MKSNSSNNEFSEVISFVFEKKDRSEFSALVLSALAWLKIHVGWKIMSYVLDYAEASPDSLRKAQLNSFTFGYTQAKSR